MLHIPSATVPLVPPCARTIPAARLLAPSPARPRSMTITRSAPELLAKYEAHPPIVPAPTMTRSARWLLMPVLRGYYRRSGGDGRCAIPLTAAITATANQSQQEELACPARVDDRRADVRADRALGFEHIQRVRPGVQRGVEEKDEEQAPPGAVVKPGRDDRQRDRANGEERERQVTLGCAVDPEQGQVPERGDDADHHRGAEHAQR